MKFKNFLESIEMDSDIANSLATIKNELATFTPDELEEFGEWLNTEIYDDEENYDDIYDYDSIIELISSLDSEDLDYVAYMLTDDDIDIDDDIDDNDDIDESIKVRFSAKQRNKKKNKKFSLSKAKFRAGAAKRKKENRMNKISRKKAYRKNKVKLKKYNKSYNAAVKKGQHIKKIRR